MSIKDKSTFFGIEQFNPTSYDRNLRNSKHFFCVRFPEVIHNYSQHNTLIHKRILVTLDFINRKFIE